MPTANRRAATAAPQIGQPAEPQQGGNGNIGGDAQPLFVMPIGGGTTFTTNPVLGPDLKVSIPTNSTVAKILAQYSEGFDGERLIFDHSLVASFILRILPVDDETRKTSVFDVTLSIDGMAAAMVAIESLPWEANAKSVTSAIRSLAEHGVPHSIIKKSDFIMVEPFPGDANQVTKKRWMQVNTLLIGDLIGGEGPIWHQNSLLSTLIVGVGAYGRAADREEGGRALAFLNEILKDVAAVVKQTSNLKREIISSLTSCWKVPAPIAIFACSLAEAVGEIAFGASMSSGAPNAVLTRLANALDALPLISAVCAQASDVPGAVIRLAKAFGHPDSIVFNTLESINAQLGDHRDLIMGELQGAAEGSSRAAAIIDQIELRIRAARNFDRANASSGLADPNAAKVEITANQAILKSPSLQALTVAISDAKLSSEMRLHMIMKAREIACLKAFFDRTTSFHLSAPCELSAKAYQIATPYFQWVCTHDENGTVLPRCGSALLRLDSTDVDRLTRGKLSSVNWAAMGAAFCKLRLPFAEGYNFPSTVGEMVNVVDAFFPVFKRIFIALGFAPEVFDEFEVSIITLQQNLLPGKWLTGLINETFNTFMEEKTNELAAFIGTPRLALAVFPGAPDMHSRSAQMVAAAITRGDDVIRARDQQVLDPAMPPHLSQALPSMAPGAASAPPAAPVAANPNLGISNGATPGVQYPKQKGNKRKSAPAATPTAPPAAAQTAAATTVTSPGRRVLPGSCTSLVQKNAAETLLKIGKTDVFDAEQLVTEVLTRSPGFNINLKRDILLLAAWLAEGSEDQRARFVPAGCDRRFIVYPFSPFNKQAYITSKKF